MKSLSASWRGSSSWSGGSTRSGRSLSERRKKGKKKKEKQRGDAKFDVDMQNVMHGVQSDLFLEDFEGRNGKAKRKQKQTRMQVGRSAISSLSKAFSRRFEAEIKVAKNVEQFLRPEGEIACIEGHGSKLKDSSEWAMQRGSQYLTKIKSQRKFRKCDFAIRGLEDLDELHANLQKGNLGSVSFENASSKVLAKSISMLNSSKSLLEIDLSGAADFGAVLLFLDAIKSGVGQQLSLLNLSRTSPSKAEFSTLAQSLAEMPELKVLLLRMCSLDEDMLEDLFHVLHRKKLYHLDLSGNRVTGCVLHVVTKSLGSMSNLVLRSCALGDADIQVLCKGLVNNAYLEELDLSGNSITSEGCLALACALVENCGLLFLDLSYNFVGPEGAEAVTEALRNSKSDLTGLDLRSCAIGRSGCGALARALESNEMLETLTIGGPVLFSEPGESDIDGDGITLLLRALKKNESLKSLHVGEAIISADAQYILHQLTSTPLKRRKALLADILSEKNGIASSMEDSDPEFVEACLEWIED